MQANDRRDYRETENFTILVNGADLNGHPFVEQTETIDISSAGVSFRLKNSISPRSFVGIDLSQSNLFGYRGKVSAMVVRVERISPQENIVAAELI